MHPRYPTLLPLWLLLLSLAGGCARYQGIDEDVIIHSRDGTQLAASLVRPHGSNGSLPAVLLLHGAEAATRSMVYRMHANVFLERGMAVLLYDKRGAGASGGSTAGASFPLLVEDALAAIEWLRNRTDVDARHIGIVGASESGWLTPEIAHRSGGLAFVVNKVGPCASWRDTVAWEHYNDLVGDGASPALAREQTAVQRRIWDYQVAPSDKEGAALQQILTGWAGRNGSQLPPDLQAAGSTPPEELRYDPSPWLQQLSTPMLYVYGSDDINVPTAQCVERLTRLRDAGRPVSFQVFQGEGHELGGIGLLGYDFTEGYAHLIGEFALRHVR